MYILKYSWQRVIWVWFVWHRGWWGRVAPSGWSRSWCASSMPPPRLHTSPSQGAEPLPVVGPTKIGQIVPYKIGQIVLTLYDRTINIMHKQAPWQVSLVWFLYFSSKSAALVKRDIYVRREIKNKDYGRTRVEISEIRLWQSDWWNPSSKATVNHRGIRTTKRVPPINKKGDTGESSNYSISQ